MVDIAVDFITAEVRCIESYRWGCKEKGERSEVAFISGRVEAFESLVGAVKESHGASAYR